MISPKLDDVTVNFLPQKLIELKTLMASSAKAREECAAG
jgi:hypothetical protein